MNSDKPAGPVFSDPASVSVQVIAPKRSWLERAKRYFTGADLDEAEAAGLKTNTRIADDLPSQVNAVAVGQLITNGLSAFSGIAFGIGAAIFAVVSPFWFGRTGVGYSMIALFGGCFTAAMATIPFFVARGAARILRRDPRGIKPVLRWAWIVATGSAFGLALMLVQGGINHSNNLSYNNLSFGRGIISLISSLAFQGWTIVTLRKYKKEVAAEIAASESENVSES